MLKITFLFKSTKFTMHFETLYENVDIFCIFLEQEFCNYTLILN